MSEKTIEELKELLEKSESENSILLGKIEKLTADNNELVKQVTAGTSITEEKPVKLIVPEKTIKYKGKEYKFALAKFTLSGIVYISEQLVEDSNSEAAQEVFAALLAIEEQGILAPVL